MELARRLGPDGQVTAIDPSGVMRLILRTRCRLLERQRIDIRNGSAEALTLPSDSIDAVLALNVMHHMDDLHQAATEITRVLKPAGRLLLIDEDFSHPDHSFYQAADDHHSPELVDPHHMTNLLTNAGLENATARHANLGGQPTHIVTASA